MNRSRHVMRYTTRKIYFNSCRTSDCILVPITHEFQSFSCQSSGGAYLTGLCSEDGCSQAPRDEFLAFREKISSDPLLVEITWRTNPQPYEFGSEKKCGDSPPSVKEEATADTTK